VGNVNDYVSLSTFIDNVIDDVSLSTFYKLLFSSALCYF